MGRPHKQLTGHIIKLFRERGELPFSTIYEECKKKYSRSTSSTVITNILSRNKNIIKTGHTKVESFTRGYHLNTVWNLKDKGV